MDRQKGANMDIAVGDTILTRKQHPCGASSFEVLRVGMDFNCLLYTSDAADE